MSISVLVTVMLIHTHLPAEGFLFIRQFIIRSSCECQMMEVENKSSRSDSFYSCLLYCVKVISPLKGAAVNLWELLAISSFFTDVSVLWVWLCDVRLEWICKLCKSSSVCLLHCARLSFLLCCSVWTHSVIRPSATFLATSSHFLSACLSQPPALCDNPTHWALC